MSVYQRAGKLGVTIKKCQRSDSMRPFRKMRFLKCVTLPQDPQSHISKSTTLPRAAYQPHAKNYQSLPSLNNLQMRTHGKLTWHIEDFPSRKPNVSPCSMDMFRLYPAVVRLVIGKSRTRVFLSKYLHYTSMMCIYI